MLILCCSLKEIRIKIRRENQNKKLNSKLTLILDCINPTLNSLAKVDDNSFSGFQSSVKSNFVFACVCIKTPCDWLAKLASLAQ